MPGTGAIRQVVLFLLLAASACEERLDPPEVEFAGCRQVLVGPVCALDEERELRLWLRAEDPEAIAISTDRDTLTAPFEAIDGGWRFATEVPSGASHLEVAVPGHRAWRLPLAEARTYERLERARTFDDLAKSKLVAEEAAKSDDPAERAQAFAMLGRLLLAESAAEKAIDTLQEAIRLHEQSGCVSCVVDDTTVVAYVLTHQIRDFRRARVLLDQIDPDTHPDPQARIWVPFHRGALAAETGDLSAALRWFDRAQQAAQRLGLSTFANSATQFRARILTALGRFGEAVSEMIESRDNMPAGLEACERAILEQNVGWVGLLAHESGEAPPELSLQEVEQSLKHALTLHQSECTRRSEAGSVLIDLALVALFRGDLNQARRRLQQADELLPATEPRLALWQLDIEGRLALADGRSEEALRSFERLAALGRDADAPDAQWRAALGRARTLRARRDVEAALAAYAASEQLLEMAARRVALGDGRDTFLGAQARGTMEHVDLLVEVGRTRQAAHVARQARRRALVKVARRDRVASLSPSERMSWDTAIGRYRKLQAELEEQTRDTWGLALAARVQQAADMMRKRAQLAQALDGAFAVLDRQSPSVSALSAPDPGELLLSYYGSDDVIWAFGETALTAMARRVELPSDDSPAALAAERLLGPFDEQIRDAERIRILTAGATAAVDIHALPWHGRPLLAHRLVAYGLDLPRSKDGTDGALAASGSKRRADRARRDGAIVLADPLGDLPGARHEASDVRSVLEARGFGPVRGLSGTAAVASTVRKELSQRDVAHFAGHGEFISAAGLKSSLALADGESLQIADVISLPRVPRVVVLAGCDTGRTRTEGSVQGLGLAQAFLLNGANAAVATTRPVRDDLSAALSHTFYEALEGLDAWDAARALRKAQLGLVRQHPSADWAAYRVMIP